VTVRLIFGLRAGRCAALALMAAMALVACQDQGDSGSSDRRPTNAIIILLDTLRADRVGCYGYERDTTPAIDALAARGTVFEQAVSPAPWTLPATGALLSGVPPELAFDADSKLKRSMIEDLAAAGFVTAAFTEAAFVSSYFGMDRGFAVFEEAGAMRTVIEGETVAGGDEGAGIVTTFAAAKRWLELHGDEPFVLLVHTYEIHMPYRRKRWSKKQPAGRFTEQLEMSDLRRLQRGDLTPTEAELDFVSALYDGGVRFADKHVGELLGVLDTLGLTDETLIVLTSDHGEELGEHYLSFTADHGHSLKDELLLVPLIVVDPTRSWAEARVPWQVRLSDVLPTVVELLGVTDARPVTGRSLVPMLSGDELRHRPAFAGHTKVGPPRRALRDGLHKLIIRDGTSASTGPQLSPAVPPLQLYDLIADPGEQHDRQAEREDLVQRLAAQLLAWQQQIGGARVELRPDADDEEVLRQLRELGYVR
jgi:arylsulfatase A-like enzyme